MDIRQKVFESRSYTPIPFILLMLGCAEPTPVSMMSGFVLAAIGEVVRFWGVSIAGSETRTTGPVGATNLITEGPFAYVRNPLYVGNMLLYCGFGVMSNALMPWLPLIAFVFFAVQYALIVSREEEHLRQAFGEEYERYVQSVPRFLPRLSAYVGEHSFHRKADLIRGFKSEQRSLQAFGLMLTILIIMMVIRAQTP